MAKNKTKKEVLYKPGEDEPSYVSEPYLTMKPINKFEVVVADFPYSKFKKIADKVPFTQSEWANILHLSERTLQRYAKDDKNFEGIYVDRILQIKKLIDEGLKTFNDANAFYKWLKLKKSVLGTELSFEALYHNHGIEELYNQLGRIQQGVYT